MTTLWRKFKYLLPSHRRAEEREMREELDSLAAIADSKELGNLTLAAEDARAAWGWTWLERLAQDLRYAARSLRGSPAFTLVAVLTLALGIGANTTIFTAVNAIFLTRLPVRQPGQLRQLSWSSRKRAFGGKSLMQPMWDAYLFNQGKTSVNFSYPVYRNLRDKTTSFSDAACERSPGAMSFVSGNFFRTIGVDAILGRTITPEDDRLGGPPVAVISYGFWQSAFGGDPQVLSRTIARDPNGLPLQTPLTIIGVLPQDYFGLNPAVAGPRIYAALQAASTPATLTDDRDWNACNAVIARLHPGISDDHARAESETLTAQAILADPPNEPYELPRLTLASLNRGQGDLRNKASQPLLILTSTTGVILLIACANIAGLLLARGTARRKEIATRLALGAPRSRIVRQLLTESLVLSALGAIAGIAIAYAASPLVPRLFTNQQTFEFSGLGVPMRPDAWVIGFSSLLAVLTALLFGLAPALHATRLNLFAMDLPAMMRTAAPVRRRFRFTSGKTMLAVQIALSTVLLIGAGLFLRTLLNLRAVPMGYEPKGLLYSVVDLDGKGAGFVDDVIERMGSVPGVRSVTASMWPLFTSAPDTYLQVCIPGDNPKNFDDRFADSDVVLPRFFETWGVPLLRGRDFVSSDSPSQVIVNDAFVKRYLASAGDPIGQTIHLGPGCFAETIIGVVGNSTDRPRVTPRPFVYRRYAQPPPQLTFAVRTPGNPAAVAPAIRRIVAGLNTRVYEQVTTGEQYRDDTMAQERLFAGLLSGFGSLALFIACLGIYGMLAYLVARRTAEIGLRVALGAQRADVMRMVIRESLAPVAIGLILGIAAAGALTRLAASLLFGVSRNDPWTIASAGIVFLLTAAVAAALPARRASSIDPMRALRRQ